MATHTPDAPGTPETPAARTLRIGLVLLTAPVALLVVAGVVVFVAAAAASSGSGPDSDGGGFAVLFALAFLGPALLASPVPALGWLLRRRHPRGSAIVVLVGGSIVCLAGIQPVLGALVGGGAPWWTALPGVLGLALGLATVAAGVRVLRLLRPTG